MNQTGSKGSRILELDALRGIASLAVVFFHLTMWRPQAKLGFGLGITGVDLFFLISGFVIYMSIENNVTWKKFAISRISRLYPTYWACVTFTFLVMLASNAYNHFFDWTLIYNYFFNLYMIQYYLNVPDLDAPYWTLAIEMLFYVFMLVVLMTKQLKRLEIIGGIGLLLVAIYSFFLKDNFSILFDSLARFFPLIKHFPLFFAGILFYKLKNKSSGRPRYVLFFGVLVCFCLQVSLYNKGAINNLFVSFQEYFFMLGIYFSVFFLFVNNMLNFIVSRVTLFLGSVSYALYLIHQYLSLSIIMPFLTEDCAWSFWPSALSNALIVITLASIVTFGIEKPAGKKMKAWLTKKL